MSDRSGPSHNRILLGLLGGAIAGVAANFLTAGHPEWERGLGLLLDGVAHPVGQIFLRLLYVIVIPIVFASIAGGVASLGDLRSLGKIGAKTFAFFAATSAIAAILGVTALRLVRPGAGFDEGVRTELMSRYGADAAAHLATASQNAPTDLLSRVNQILDMVLPRNVPKAAVEGQLVPLIAFALVFGAALTLVEPRRRAVMTNWLEALTDTVVAIVGIAMKLAPLAVFCLIFSVTARFGWGLLEKLGLFVIVILGCYLIQLFVLYPAMLLMLARRRPGKFLRDALPVIVTAFSTSSSSATLPTSIRVAEQSLGIRPAVAGFVLPLGATMNMNGTALFEGAVVLFTAQVFGVELSVSQQFTVVALAVVTSIGAAGVPGGSLPLLAGVMTQVGVPADGLALILGVDRILDMGRTVTNVMGDQVCAAFVEAGEGPRADPPTV